MHTARVIDATELKAVLAEFLRPRDLKSVYRAAVEGAESPFLPREKAASRRQKKLAGT